MTTLTRLRLIGAAALLSSAAALSAVAQTQTPAPDTPTTPPAAKPAPAPTPPTGMTPSDPAKTPAAPSATERQSAAPAKNPMIGLNVFSSDGSKLGSVQSVDTGPEGKVRAIRFKTGGFLGFGGKLVEIPEGKFTKSGDNVQLGMTSDEVSKLPEVKNQS